MQKLKRIEWIPKYSVGFDELDEQHKTLFATINKAMDAYEENQDLIEVLTELSDYLGSHFRSEEDVMASMRYPRREKHHEKHMEFNRKYMKFLEDYEQGKESLARDLLVFLRDWLINHVLKDEDPGYSKYYQKLTAEKKGTE